MSERAEHKAWAAMALDAKKYAVDRGSQNMNATT
ncbi:hypothetical protein QO003_001824 [Arthrobacter silviterrae]|nr:hypothetical protein [Arthrobacter silviterrae]